MLLQKLETLPLAYIREGLIIRDELNLAAVAYQAGQEPASLDAYVSRWDETAHWEGESALKPLVGLRLDEIVYMARGTIQAYKRHTAIQRAHIERQRELPDSERMEPRDVCIDAIPRRFADHGIDAPKIDFPAMCRDRENAAWATGSHRRRAGLDPRQPVWPWTLDRRAAQAARGLGSVLRGKP
jgi:hypothetical protein